MRPAEETVVRQCAPTLAGIKTGSLFPCPYDSRQQLLADIRRMNRVLVPRGLCLLPMRLGQGRALLYLYRPQALRRDLDDDLSCRLLRQAGYPCGSCGQCVARLVQRLRTEEEFPHEVGLFLSYPPEDVQGFIDHRAEDFKCPICSSPSSFPWRSPVSSSGSSWIWRCRCLSALPLRSF